MTIFAGVDIGSTTGKALLLNDEDKILASTIMEVTTRPEKTARICIDEVLRQAGLKEEAIDFMVGTGYGRVKIPFASDNISEITCHARGVHAALKEVCMISSELRLAMVFSGSIFS